MQGRRGRPEEKRGREVCKRDKEAGEDGRWQRRKPKEAAVETGGGGGGGGGDGGGRRVAMEEVGGEEGRVQAGNGGSGRVGEEVQDATGRAWRRLGEAMEVGWWSVCGGGRGFGGSGGGRTHGEMEAEEALVTVGVVGAEVGEEVVEGGGGGGEHGGGGGGGDGGYK
ncbi:hypothetical protein CYMTET_47080 [Cymbomonas tetramitiformis]|uniref:Uncharacterized protein n=1 Tax=Cymbomonas tetramitiformis TaxID=36881 RepID=A0AAE0BUX3_9CHLO|nr:hypothetical protein CYMTET_47080 [Cymbomonas tetramitiformis]